MGAIFLGISPKPITLILDKVGQDSENEYHTKLMGLNKILDIISSYRMTLFQKDISLYIPDPRVACAMVGRRKRHKSECISHLEHSLADCLTQFRRNQGKFEISIKNVNKKYAWHLEAVKLASKGDKGLNKIFDHSIDLLWNRSSLTRIRHILSTDQ